MRLPIALVAAALTLAGCAASAPTWTAGLGSSPASTASARAATTSSVAAAPTPSSSAPVTPTIVARPRPTPCTSNTHRRWVFVSLRRQHLWMCARTRVVRDTPITSGMIGQYTETPTGTYVIQGVTRNTSLTLLSGESYAVDYWIPFDGPLFGFHDSSWQKFPYGSSKYHTDGSHGCVHMPLAAIRFMAGWAQVGTPVTIRAR